MVSCVENPEIKLSQLEGDSESLEILNSKEYFVEFKATFIENGSFDIIHENSVFCKENNYWVYLNAK